MIYTPMTVLAMKTAYDAHHGQLDKNGVPYIFHPIHLAEQMYDELTCTAALLHDVVEDTSVTMDDLKKLFPPEVIRVVSLLTHEDGTDYFDYVRKIKTDPAAAKIKLADLEHNSDDSRIVPGSGISKEHRKKQLEKYAEAKRILTEQG